MDFAKADRAAKDQLTFTCTLKYIRKSTIAVDEVRNRFAKQIMNN